MEDQQTQEALEYDLLTGGARIDLGDFYTGRLTLRRLRVLVAGLPASSRLWTVLRRRNRELGDEHTVPIEELPPETWSHEAWLLAEVHDRIAQLAWMFACAHTREDHPNPSAPQPMPRPTGTPRRRRAVGAWFAGAGVPLAES